MYQALADVCWGAECMSVTWTTRRKEMTPKTHKKKKKKRKMRSVWNGAGYKKFRSGSRLVLCDMIVHGK